MTAYLLHGAVLIALIDASHVQHDAAHEWFEQHGHKAWATSPLTENGLLRIVGQARYPKSPGNAGRRRAVAGGLARAARACVLAR